MLHGLNHLAQTVLLKNIRLAERLDSQSHQLHRAIIAPRHVRAQLAALDTAVNNGPVAIISHPNTDSLHATTTGRRPIARGFVQVLAGQAVGTVVTMIGPRPLWRHPKTTITALKGV